MSFKQLAPIHLKGSGFIPSVELVFLVQFLEMIDGVIVMKMFCFEASFFLFIITESLTLSQRFFGGFALISVYLLYFLSSTLFKK